VFGAIRFATSSEKTDVTLTCRQCRKQLKEFRWVAVTMNLPIITATQR
jgi:hypothetical protein